VLTAQLLAVAHFHQLSFGKNFSAQTAASQDVQCALCLLVSHVPSGFVSPPSLQQPQVEREYTPHASRLAVRVFADCGFFGRAPPASL
jgi:hypothetical protein